MWRQRWKTAIAIYSLLLPSLPAFPNTVIVNVSPRTPCTRQTRVTREPFEENEDKKRNGKDERNGKGSPIETGTYEKIPPSPLKRMEEFVLTKPLRRVVLSNFKGGPPKSILYFVSMNWLIIASALFSIFVNSCRPLLVN